MIGGLRSQSSLKAFALAYPHFRKEFFEYGYGNPRWFATLKQEKHKKY